jgi:hypothetical protein
MKEPAETAEPWRDPIVEEVRSARVELFASCGFDLDELARRLQERQRAEGRVVVNLVRRAEAAQAEGETASGPRDKSSSS